MPQGRIINCEGCGKPFMTQTALWGEHYAECHRPAIERAREEQQQHEAQRRVEYFVDGLVEVLDIPKPKARELLALIQEMINDPI